MNCCVLVGRLVVTGKRKGAAIGGPLRLALASEVVDIDIVEGFDNLQVQTNKNGEARTKARAGEDRGLREVGLEELARGGGAIVELGDGAITESVIVIRIYNLQDEQSESATDVVDYVKSVGIPFQSSGSHEIR